MALSKFFEKASADRAYASAAIAAAQQIGANSVENSWT
jgi:hypothetical protein